MNTTSTYLAIERNLTRYQAMTAADPTVKADTAYYQAHIGKVTSIGQLVSNYRLLSYAMNAYGLGDQVNNKALITKVLQQGTTSPKALANTLANPAWKAFAKAFDFSAKGSASPTSAASVATTTADYKEQQLEANQGQTNPGVELALYFKRVAPTITNNYGILGDQNLLEVVQTAFGLPATASAAQIDKEAKSVAKLVPLADLADPKKLNQIVERFTAAYDAKYGPASGNSSTLKVANGNTPSVTPASQTILGGIVSSNAYQISTLKQATFFNNSVLNSLMGIKLGG